MVCYAVALLNFCISGFPSSSYGGFGAAPPNSNVIVVDTNSLDEKEKVSKKAKKKAAKKAAEAASQAATPSSPWGAPSMPQQNSIPGIGLGGMAPQQQVSCHLLNANYVHGSTYNKMFSSNHFSPHRLLPSPKSGRLLSMEAMSHPQEVVGVAR